MIPKLLFVAAIERSAELSIPVNAPMASIVSGIPIA